MLGMKGRGKRCGGLKKEMELVVWSWVKEELP